MNTNYDKLMLQRKSQLKGQKPTLLLHVCCAPCATYCLTQLLDVFDITLLYFNNNITNSDEWQKRLEEIQKLVDIVNNGQFVVNPIASLKLIVPKHVPQEFLQTTKDLADEKEGGARCTVCFEQRLGYSISVAEENCFDFVTTTLSVSPYKNSQLLNEIGMRLAVNQTQWLPSDFKKRNGYNQSIELCNKYNIYRQHYCGCCYSLAQMQSVLNNQ